MLKRCPTGLFDYKPSVTKGSLKCSEPQIGIIYIYIAFYMCLNSLQYFKKHRAILRSILGFHEISCRVHLRAANYKVLLFISVASKTGKYILVPPIFINQSVFQYLLFLLSLDIHIYIY